MADNAFSIGSRRPETGANARPVSASDIPSDGILYLPVQASRLTSILEEGIVGHGAFFTKLPTAYGDPEVARRVGKIQHGEDLNVISVDTNGWNFEGMTINQDRLDEIIIWRSIAPDALAIIEKKSAQGYKGPTL